MGNPIVSDLPDVYGPLLPQLFSSQIPREEFATCDRCAMACRPVEARTFLPDKKCCTFYPSLPNYLVGAILSETIDSEGRRRLLNIISARRGIFPCGVFPPRIYLTLYSKGRQRAFGNSNHLLCPYFVKETGLCSIWRHREAICSTFFCRTVAGRSGKQFWESLKKYLLQVQESLISHALLQLMPQMAFEVVTRIMSPDYDKTLSAEDLDSGVSEGEYRELWGDWQGREIEFFKECYRLIQKLDGSSFEKIVGVAHNLNLADLAGKYAKATRTPPIMARNASLPVWKGEDDYYSVLFDEIGETLKIPRYILDAFDGERQTIDVIASLKEQGVEISLELLLSLYHSNALKNPSHTA